MWQHSQGCDIHGSIPAGSISSHLLPFPYVGGALPRLLISPLPCPLAVRVRGWEIRRGRGFIDGYDATCLQQCAYFIGLWGVEVEDEDEDETRRWMRLRCQWTASGGTLIGARCSVFDARSGMAGPTYVCIHMHRSGVCTAYVYVCVYVSRLSHQKHTQEIGYARYTMELVLMSGGRGVRMERQNAGASFGREAPPAGPRWHLASAP